MMTRLPKAAMTAVILSLAITWIAGAQSLSSFLGPLAALDVATLVPADDPATDPAATQSVTTDPPNMPKFGNYQASWLHAIDSSQVCSVARRRADCVAGESVQPVRYANVGSV
jgi:hypothetical protein